MIWRNMHSCIASKMMFYYYSILAGSPSGNGSSSEYQQYSYPQCYKWWVSYSYILNAPKHWTGHLSTHVKIRRQQNFPGQITIDEHFHFELSLA